MALPFPSFHSCRPWGSVEPHPNPNPSNSPANAFPSPNPNPSFPVGSSHDSYAALDVESFQDRIARRSCVARDKAGIATDRNGGSKVHGRKLQKGRRRNHSLDLEFDFVLVQSDYFSSSDSEGSDWSVGWFEPHAPEFCSETEPEKSFAVLVPCYGAPSQNGGHGGKGRFGQEDKTEPPSNSKSQLWAAVLSNLSNNSHADTNYYLQQWVSSLQT